MANQQAIRKKEDGDLNGGNSGGGVEKWSTSGDILRVELTTFAELIVGQEIKR